MKIAIVEDDINMRKSLELFFAEHKDLRVVTFRSPKDALKELDSSFQLVITDLNMPHMNGLDFLKQLNNRYEMIVITGNATLHSAIDSIRLGVKDFFQKPFEPSLLLEAVYRSKRVLEFQQTHTKTTSPKAQAINKQNPFAASSPLLESLQERVKKVAPTDSSVLLMGASGVGKEVFARYIHEHSHRAKKPFIAINMAAIPEHLLESELFGYEKGAFTDAVSAKQGLFELADGGTLFLDEIGEMPIMLQAKLLRALQEREATRLGGSKPIGFDVRIISATNANLEQKIAQKAFREDLFYRLQTIPVLIPPLKERTEEILPIAQWKLSLVLAQYNLPEKSFSKAAKDALLAYEWHGNIRELLSVIERAAILSESEQIEPKDLFLEARSGDSSARGSRSAAESSQASKIESLEKQLLQEVLQESDGNIARASALLGMSEEILRHKIAKYAIEAKI
ncbi:sigma-54 dependent transcriptional regulator [uncultured Helicobacter sp.]|uniref:sigma-54-dependent transcriptional regulator n=1 Tax=uncultured Helicobacter sp. TaxID=175537 RepID=UPI0026159EC2|nr:sigma-54 dependent transcriptional regulator [uncultured Helicobacter sp.]